ncbi:0ecc612e-7f55-4799-a821-48e090405e89 [Thermothielavioides terrestris]|uniref:0ecc612e-7f55-4799-a821-48e090405e89 n=1 Tax=Thermothielavioides terrestris TaxID=2587410 RepID=A0A3S4AKP1_9PEZI|nr:0ecc612e-7f55-4799-a821-48e090405e89 [Thermothielavioides terrestris]
MASSKPEQPDSPPKHLHVGAINPFALVEAILGRKVDWDEAATPLLLSSILQTDYEELFDMRFNSVLYAGSRLNERGDAAELIPTKDMHTLTEHDLVTPDFSRVEKLGDLADMGLKDLQDIKVKHAIMSNGNLRLTLEPRTLGKTLRSSQVTTTLRELCTPYRMHKKEEWTPPNGSWVDISACYRQDATMFTNPVQGAVANSWLIAALMSVAWSDPATIEHCSRRSSSSTPSPSTSSAYPPSSFSSYASSPSPSMNLCTDCRAGFQNASYLGSPSSAWHGAGGWYSGQSQSQSQSQSHIQGHDHRHKAGECSLSVKLYSKGGDMDAPTSTVTVNCELPTNNSSSLLMYCRPSSMDVMRPAWQRVWGGDIWPALYEKAFAKWLTSSSSSSSSEQQHQHPDLTQTSYGDPVKAMAQLTDKEPQYFFTARRRAQDLLGLVRTHSFNLRTIYPTVAWTRPTDATFRGCTLVGNMAYSVLGWAAPQERKQYVILRHPWGVTEPEGVTSYPGLVAAVDAKFWPPIELVDRNGVFAIEKAVFKEYFAGMGVAK